MPEKIWKKTGKKEGPTVAVIGGVHGNEWVGVELVRKMASDFTPDAGTVYLIEANPPAVEAKVRYVHKNLNRCFLPGNAGNAPEDVRAREIMSILDVCDASIDVHMSTNPKSTPFVICEPEAFKVASGIAVPIVSSGWDAIEPGATDGYMHNAGKISLCVESGSRAEWEKYLPFAERAVLHFLSYFGLMDTPPSRAAGPQRHIRAYKAIFKESEDFSFYRPFYDFEPLKEGEPIARDSTKEYVAKENDCIIFPHQGAAVGAEAFILGEEIAPD